MGILVEAIPAYDPAPGRPFTDIDAWAASRVLQAAHTLRLQHTAVEVQKGRRNPMNGLN